MASDEWQQDLMELNDLVNQNLPKVRNYIRKYFMEKDNLTPGEERIWYGYMADEKNWENLDEIFEKTVREKTEFTEEDINSHVKGMLDLMVRSADYCESYTRHLKKCGFLRKNNTLEDAVKECIIKNMKINFISDSPKVPAKVFSN